VPDGVKSLLTMSQEEEERPEKAPDNKAFLAWLETLPDPEQRYRAATSALEEYQGIVNQLSELRAGAVADASAQGPVSSVARRFGVSRQRAYQLLQQARTRRPAPEEQKRRKGRQKGTEQS
jgi:hypothetical protein